MFNNAYYHNDGRVPLYSNGILIQKTNTFTRTDYVHIDSNLSVISDCPPLLSLVVLRQNHSITFSFSQNPVIQIKMNKKLLVQDVHGHFGSDDSIYTFEKKKITLMSRLTSKYPHCKKLTRVIEVEIGDLFEKIYKHSEQLAMEYMFLEADFNCSNLLICQFDLKVENYNNISLTEYSDSILNDLQAFDIYHVTTDCYFYTIDNVKFSKLPSD